MKEDAPAPKDIPRKRRQLEAAPDLWLAVWLDRDLLPPERRRVQEEKDRRRAARARQSRLVGVVLGYEGVTPPQREAIGESLRGGLVTEVYSNQQLKARWLRSICHDLGVPIHHDSPGNLIRAVDMVIAAPRETIAPTNTPTWERSPVWAAISYAKHRSIAVKVILSDGKEYV